MSRQHKSGFGQAGDIKPPLIHGKKNKKLLG